MHRTLHTEMESPSPEEAPTSLKRIFLSSLFLLILPPLIFLPASIWAVYLREVHRVETELILSNEQVAGLASRLFLALLDRAASQLSQEDTSGIDSSPLIRYWEETDPAGRVVRHGPAAATARELGSHGFPLRAIVSEDGRAYEVSEAVPFPAGEGNALLVRVSRADGGARTAMLDTGYLHQQLSSRADNLLDRHVYAVDKDGRLFFYSDMALVVDQPRLAENPPVSLFLAGGKGPLRFTSSVSSKERVGYVLRMPKTDWGLVVSADIGDKLLSLRDRFLWLFVALAAGVVAALAVFFRFNRRIAGPLLALTAQLKRPDRKAFEPLKLPAKALEAFEFRGLVGDINRHIGWLREAEEKAILSEQLATLGELSAGLAHEIGTPLNVMRGSAQLILKRLEPDDPNRPGLEKIIRQTERIADLIRALLDVARTDEGAAVPVEIARVIDRAADTVRTMFPGVTFEIDVENVLPAAPGHPRRLEHALLNLLANGCQAMEGRGVIRVSAFSSRERDIPWINVVVEDHGCGIPAENLKRIFQPFFSTKGSGEGTGLGLSLVDRVVKEHGGTIEVESVPGLTRFAVRLPVEEKREDT